MEHLTPTIRPAVERLQTLLAQNCDKRICIVGTSCVGKTTLLDELPGVLDMDDLLFGNIEKGMEPLLNKEEIAYVCGPWTPEVGKFMAQRAQELIEIEVGSPVIGTIVFPADVVIEITTPDDVLRERIQRRGMNENDVFAMKAQIESKIDQLGIERIVVKNI